MVAPGGLAPSAERVESDLTALAALSDRSRPGWTRIALTEAELAGRHWALSQLRDLGLDPRIDPATSSASSRAPAPAPAAPAR
jgi:hypothetical protein